MITQHSKQVFNVVDPHSLEILQEKARLDVHNDGDWHLALTAFIFRKSQVNGGVEVLVQERSEYVDIAQKHFDQSLATQFLVSDKNDPEVALFRGLREELAVMEGDVKKFYKWNELGQMYICKQYSDNPELWNREVMINYLVILNDDVEIKVNFKVQNYQWLPWEEFCNLVSAQPNKFTKSVRAYCVADSLAEQISKGMKNIIENKKPSMFQGTQYYLSYADIDVIAINQETSLWDIEIYKTNYSMRKYSSAKLSDVSVVESVLFDQNRVEYGDRLIEKLVL